MWLNLPDLGDRFTITPLNNGNTRGASEVGGIFGIRPGVYLILREGVKAGRWTAETSAGRWKLGEYVAPPPADRSPLLVYDPIPDASAGKPLIIHVKAVGLDPADGLTLQPAGFGFYRPLSFQREDNYDYTVTLPAEWMVPGIFHYRIVLQKSGRHFTWPGNYPGDPGDWDYDHPDSYELQVSPDGAPLGLYDATADKHVMVYPVFRRGIENRLIPDGNSGRVVLRLAERSVSSTGGIFGEKDDLLGFQAWFGDRLSGRQSELAGFHTIVIRARSAGSQPVKGRLTMITRDAIPFTGVFDLQPEFHDVEIPIESLRQDSMLILPRPYPGFLPLWFSPSGQHGFSLPDAERLQMTVTGAGFEVESIWFKR
jgi:hypothetical protein